MGQKTTSIYSHLPADHITDLLLYFDVEFEIGSALQSDILSLYMTYLLNSQDKNVWYPTEDFQMYLADKEAMVLNRVE